MKDDYTKMKEKDAAEDTKLGTAVTDAQAAYDKTVTDEKKDGDAKLKAKLDSLKDRRKKIQESVAALKKKLETVTGTLSDLDEADKKRAKDLIAADEKRAGDLKEKLEGAQKTLKAKRTAI